MYLKSSLRCFLCVKCLIPVWLWVFNSHCCSASQTSIWPSWYGVQDDGSVGEPSASLPPSSSLSQLDMPPPYEAVSGGKPDSLYDYTPVCTGTEIINFRIIKKMYKLFYWTTLKTTEAQQFFFIIIYFFTLFNVFFPCEILWEHTCNSFSLFLFKLTYQDNYRVLKG